MNNPALRAVTFDQMRDAYAEQVRGLMDGGADLLLVETIFDTLNAKAALVAIEDVFEETGRSLPVAISVTITDRSGRTLSGQTIEAFWVSIAHASPFSRGPELRARREGHAAVPGRAGRRSPPATSVATRTPGLPNAFGEYDELPEMTAAALREFADAGLVNIVGGCCGTTPDHIAAHRAHRRRAHAARRRPGATRRWAQFSGLEALTIRPDANFQMIGERTNVTGSAKFARLVKGGDYAAAVEVAHRSGAQRREPHRHQHGRGHARFRAGHDDVPEPAGDRAGGGARPVHDRQLEVVGARGRPEVRAGQGRSSTRSA